MDLEHAVALVQKGNRKDIAPILVTLEKLPPTTKEGGEQPYVNAASIFSALNPRRAIEIFETIAQGNSSNGDFFSRIWEFAHKKLDQQYAEHLFNEMVEKNEPGRQIAAEILKGMDIEAAVKLVDFANAQKIARVLLKLEDLEPGKPVQILDRLTSLNPLSTASIVRAMSQVDTKTTAKLLVAASTEVARAVIQEALPAIAMPHQKAARAKEIASLFDQVVALNRREIAAARGIVETDDMLGGIKTVATIWRDVCVGVSEQDLKKIIHNLGAIAVSMKSDTYLDESKEIKNDTYLDVFKEMKKITGGSDHISDLIAAINTIEMEAKAGFFEKVGRGIQKVALSAWDNKVLLSTTILVTVISGGIGLIPGAFLLHLTGAQLLGGFVGGLAPSFLYNIAVYPWGQRTRFPKRIPVVGGQPMARDARGWAIVAGLIGTGIAAGILFTGMQVPFLVSSAGHLIDHQIHSKR